MTRKLSTILLFFAHLAMLPGCRHLAERVSDKVSSEEPKKVEEQPEPRVGRAWQSQDETPPLPVLENDMPKRTRLPQGPTETENKKPSTGIVTLEPDQDSSILTPTQGQAPQPLPLLDGKTDYEPIVLALQRMLEGRHQDAIKHLSVYEDSKQELFLRLLPPLTILVKKKMEDLTPQDVAVLNKQFQSLIDDLRPRSELVIARMCYCKEVRNYGWYEALPDHHQFLAGTQDRIGELVQLYVEIKNFASEPTKDGDFVTKLSCSLELHDEAGKQVWSKRFDGKEGTLRRRTRLNDLYSRYGFYVPAIPAGRYRLTINVADETNPDRRRVAEKSLVFQVTPVAIQPPPR